jgi:diguanylate cyclase (GGDEF)-like protein
MAKKTGVRGRGTAGRKSGSAARKPASSRPAATSLQSGIGVQRDKQTIRRLKTELARALALVGELQALAETDFLLGIRNRRGFERDLARAIAYIKRYQANAALIVLDVDRLKPINDTFGHAAGDEVLKAVAATLATQVRSSDIVARLGGDEFAVLLWNLSETDARAKAASMEQAVDRLRFVFDGRKVAAGASAGVAILGGHAEIDKALEAADSAMYVRKAQRRHEATGAGEV